MLITTRDCAAALRDLADKLEFQDGVSELYMDIKVNNERSYHERHSQGRVFIRPQVAIEVNINYVEPERERL